MEWDEFAETLDQSVLEDSIMERRVVDDLLANIPEDIGEAIEVGNAVEESLVLAGEVVEGSAILGSILSSG